MDYFVSSYYCEALFCMIEYLVPYEYVLRTWYSSRYSNSWSSQQMLTFCMTKADGNSNEKASSKQQGKGNRRRRLDSVVQLLHSFCKGSNQNTSQGGSDHQDASNNLSFRASAMYYESAILQLFGRSFLQQVGGSTMLVVATVV